MRRRHRRALLADDAIGIPLSPLIDCVFLLLIFFLVTTMLKRKETLIPVELPDATSAVAAEAREIVTVLGLDVDGRLLQPSGRDRFGAVRFQPAGDLAAYLDALIEQDGNTAVTRPLHFDVHRDTPFQKTLDALDAAHARGFRQVSVKLFAPPPPAD
jgi:biopolymer transport protein ExbD